MKKLLLMLTIAFAMVFATGSVAEAKGEKTVTVKKADTKTAKKLHTQLNKGQKFYVRVAGSKTASKKLLGKVNDKIEAVNELGVRFQFSSPKKQGKYTRYTVSADKAKSYKYAVQLIGDIRKRYLAGEFEFYEIINDANDGERIKELVAGTKFYKLSDAVKVYVLSRAFDNNGGSPYIQYNDGKKYKWCTNDYSDSKILSKLLKGSMKGVCHDFTNSEIVLCKQLGITCFYGISKKENHAMSVARVKNSDGKLMYMCWNYEGLGSYVSKYKYERTTPVEYRESGYTKRWSDRRTDWTINAKKKYKNELVNNDWKSADIK